LRFAVKRNSKSVAIASTGSPPLATSLPFFTRSKLELAKAAWDEFWIMDCVRAKERAQALEANDSGVWTLADIQEVFDGGFGER
jgi:hypothetical protein